MRKEKEGKRRHVRIREDDDYGVGVVRTVAESWLIEKFRREGWMVYKPHWPEFLLVSPADGEKVMVELERIEERLTRKKKLSFTLLKKVGFNVMVMKPTRGELITQKKRVLGTLREELEEARHISVDEMIEELRKPKFVEEIEEEEDDTLKIIRELGERTPKPLSEADQLAYEEHKKMNEELLKQQEEEAKKWREAKEAEKQLAEANKVIAELDASLKKQATKKKEGQYDFLKNLPSNQIEAELGQKLTQATDIPPDPPSNSPSDTGEEGKVDEGKVGTNGS